MAPPHWQGQKTVQRYDPINDNWLYMAEMQEGRVGHTSNVIAGKIYTIGGDTQTPPVLSVEEYDPNLDSWTVIDTTPSVMISSTATVFENKIYTTCGSLTDIHVQLTHTSDFYSYQPDTTVSVEFHKNIISDVFVLYQNYPNPFNSSTRISYTIAKSDFVTLKINDMLGRELATLVNEKQKPGTYEIEFDARELTGGFYFYTFKAGSFVETKKMIFGK
ncbi:T9SS type A sorting domain-containing protein [Bacteroidota bacterium]